MSRSQYTVQKVLDNRNNPRDQSYKPSSMIRREFIRQVPFMFSWNHRQTVVDSRQSPGLAEDTMVIEGKFKLPRGAHAPFPARPTQRDERWARMWAQPWELPGSPQS